MNTSTQSKVNTNGVYKMTEELEKLEKEFILSEDMEHEDIKGLIQKILVLCKIDNKGFVVINKSQLRVKDKIMLVLSARHLANKLQQKLGRGELISEEVPIKDVASTIGTSSEINSPLPSFCCNLFARCLALNTNIILSFTLS